MSGGEGKSTAASVACVPLVSYDLRKSGPWVSELGVGLANWLAVAIHKAGVQDVIGTEGVASLLAAQNLARGSLVDRADLIRFAPRLGVDLLVYGSTKLDRGAAGIGIDLLTVQLAAWDVRSERVVAEGRYELTSQVPDSSWEWQELARDSLWDARSSFRPAEGRPSLHKELALASKVLAARLIERFGKGDQKARIFVAPCETAEYSRAIADLRAAQRSYADAVDAASKSALAKTGAASASIQMAGQSFETLAAARSFLTRLEQGLREAPAARFGRTVSEALIEAITAQKAGVVSPVADLGFAETSDRNFVLGRLYSGGLLESASARRQMQDAGYRGAILPRLERIGTHFAIRVLALDLSEGRVAGSASFGLQKGVGKELAQSLGVKAKKGVPPKTETQRKESAADWKEVYDSSIRAAVQVASKKGWGSGFLVSPKGHVITNHHVVAGLRAVDRPELVFPGGFRSPYRVLAFDKAFDVAVLLPLRIPKGFAWLRFASRRRARVGVQVAVLGRPKHTQSFVLTPGYLSSVEEKSLPRGTKRYLYTAPTRQGSSGSPVLLEDGTVIAVHSEGSIGQLARGQKPTELTGFARGVPGEYAVQLLQKAGVRATVSKD